VFARTTGWNLPGLFHEYVIRMAMRAKTNPETTVRISRRYRAPVQRVFDAWTHISSLRTWWGGEGVTTHELIFEPRIHGEFHWVCSDAEGHLHTVNGEVRELVSREKIAFTWIAVEGTPHFDHDDHHERDGRHRHTHHLDRSRVTVDFREGQGVEVRVLHTDLPDRETRDAMEQLWHEALERLERALVGR
jgi:uncharacterized protein YndB with AHSA1/START domain